MADEKITLTEFRKRFGGISEPTSQLAWKRGRLVGRRTGNNDRGPLELDWVASAKSYCQDSKVFAIKDYDLVNVITGQKLWTFTPEQLQQYTFLQRVKPANQLSTSSVEGELKNLEDFAKLGLQVYDQKGNVRNIITLAHEQEALFKAKRAQLDFEKELHRLVEIEVVQRLISNMAADTCKAILTVPDRVAPVLSTMDDPTEIHKYLTDELNYALSSLSLEMEKAFTNGTEEGTNDESSNDDELPDVGVN